MSARFGIQSWFCGIFVNIYILWSTRIWLLKKNTGTLNCEKHLLSPIITTFPFRTSRRIKIPINEECIHGCRIDWKSGHTVTISKLRRFFCVNHTTHETIESRESGYELRLNTTDPFFVSNMLFTSAQSAWAGNTTENASSALRRRRMQELFICICLWLELYVEKKYTYSHHTNPNIWMSIWLSP